MKYIYTILFFLPTFFAFGHKYQVNYIVRDSINTLILKYSQNADSLFKTQDYAQALPIYLKIDSIAKESNFENFITIKSLLKRAEISRLTFTKESTNLAYSIANEALSRAKKLESQEAIHYVYVHLADIAGLKNNYNEAKQYIDLALEYYLKTENDKYVSRMYLVNSVYYLAVDSLDKADESRYKAIKYLESRNNEEHMVNAKYYYGYFLRYRRKNYKKAISFLEDSKCLHEKIGREKDLIFQRCLRELAICHDELGNYEDSKNYYKLAYNLNIELNKKANRNTSRRLEAKYQSEKKEKEIALLTSENELIKQKQKNQKNMLLGGLTLTSLGGLFLFFLYQNRKKTNKKLKELDKIKSNFFANISHEFRTPLTLINQPINTVLEDDTISENRKQQFIIAKENSKRLQSLVDELLDLSKIDAGQFKLHIQKGNPIQLISVLIDSFAFQAQQKQIQYNSDIQNFESDAYFDKEALEKIVINLLSNAIKYTPVKGRILCDVSIKDYQLSISIENSGNSLSEEEIQRIFERFYQTNEKNYGTGIGLALVKELVELHKGNISVHSKPGENIKFSVMLPVDKNNFKNEIFIEASNQLPSNEIPNFPILPSESFNDSIDKDKPILLIAEDNDDLRLMLKQTFDKDYNIILANNGEDGISDALEHIPDLIISDVMMPKKDGIELTQTLKNDERTSHIPIILLTAKAGDENKLLGIEVGADDYITKPFNTKLLSTKVLKLIENRQLLQKRYSQELVLIPKDIAVTDLDEQFLEKVQDILDTNLVEASFSVKEFSEAIGMSRMQLHRKLKALTGLATTEFIRSQRLKLAAQLLKNSDANVSQIGYQVGFNNPSYFSKCFRNTYGCSPSEYATKPR